MLFFFLSAIFFTGIASLIYPTSISLLTFHFPSLYHWRCNGRTLEHIKLLHWSAFLFLEKNTWRPGFKGGENYLAHGFSQWSISFKAGIHSREKFLDSWHNTGAEEENNAKEKVTCDLIKTPRWCLHNSPNIRRSLLH